MRIITNSKKIERNRKIGLFTSLGSLVILVLGMVLSFVYTQQIALAYGAMILGLILSQVGIYYGNRWGRSPRIDERITQSLKGLDDRYVLYHYTTQVPHLIAGPAGLWVLVPEYQSGTITFEKNRFKQSGVNFLTRFFAQEGIGRPELEAQAYKQDFEKSLKKLINGDQLPDIQPLIVFVNPKASVQVSESTIPAMHVDKLKDFIRRKAKEQPADLDAIEAIEDLLPGESV